MRYATCMPCYAAVQCLSSTELGGEPKVAPVIDGA